ncbi:MAG: GDP-mannose 4,6-dehydratase, partial [Nanoarchaeota archaeon]|nr:GDP-mannose 4,6-dehydratase [Nanoarchaeota archaeon]
MKTALITGITGQDGSYLAELLLKKKYKVLGMVRRTSTINFERIQHIQDKVEIVQGDLMDQMSLIEILNEYKVDEIYNLAAQSFVPTSWNQPVLTGEVTAMGVTRVLEAIRIVNKKIKFYQASSSEMFGKVNETPQTEKTRFHPRSPYGVSKVYGYWITVNYRESYGIHACNGILFNHECVSENTPVIIRDKKTKIISICSLNELRKPKEKGRNVQQWSPTALDIWDGVDFAPLKLITATKRKKKEDDFRCRTINTRHGVVVATNHHKMLESNGNKIKAKLVKDGQTLLHGAYPSQKSISKISKEEAAFLGFMAGDGYISETGRANFSNNDTEILLQLENLWRQVGLGYVNKKE